MPGGGQGNPLQYSCLGQRSLLGYCPWGFKESDMTEATEHKQGQGTHGRLAFSRKKLLFYTTNLCRNSRKMYYAFSYLRYKEGQDTAPQGRTRNTAPSFTKQVNCDNIIVCIPWYILNRIQSYREKQAADINSTFQEFLQ